MVKVTAIESQLDRLSRPTPLFKLWTYTTEGYAKWKNCLLNHPLHMSDERRSESNAINVIQSILFGTNLNISYDINEGCGVVSFLNIVPHFKCNVCLHWWDKSAWNKAAIRQGRQLLDVIKTEFDLRKLETSTSDLTVKRMTEMLGFKEEGRARMSFMSNGILYDTYYMGLLGGDNV